MSSVMHRVSSVMLSSVMHRASCIECHSSSNRDVAYNCEIQISPALQLFFDSFLAANDVRQSVQNRCTEP